MAAGLQRKCACGAELSGQCLRHFRAYRLAGPAPWFFNGTSLLLRVHGQEAQPHQLRISPSAQVPDWKLATGLSAVEVDAQGFGTYTAGNYDELVDCPVEMGNF